MVGNMSQHWSRSLLDVEVAYETDIEQAKAVIKRVADQVWKADTAVLEEPDMWGVEQLGASGVRPPPGRQDDAERAVARLAPAARADQGGIRRGRDRDPVPQQAVWYRGQS